MKQLARTQQPPRIWGLLSFCRHRSWPRIGNDGKQLVGSHPDHISREVEPESISTWFHCLKPQLLHRLQIICAMASMVSIKNYPMESCYSVLIDLSIRIFTKLPCLMGRFCLDWQNICILWNHTNSSLCKWTELEFLLIGPHFLFPSFLWCLVSLKCWICKTVLCYHKNLVQH